MDYKDINYPDWYPALDNEKKDTIIEHCKRYNIEPDVCAYYDDWDDFCSDWCEEIGYTEEEAHDMLYGSDRESEFLIFEGRGIIRFSL